MKQVSELEPRESLLDLIRQQLKDYPVIVRAVFELSYYSPISALQIISLSVSDIHLRENLVKVRKNGIESWIPITLECAELLEQIIDSNQPNSPLFRNNEGQRLSLEEMFFIKRLFWYRVKP
ncbi:hypothetical protein UF75_4640 [Desulfosporosinus sp. I2]|uniref:tyrosine-type recombinase/integrase n=1 Tax=Desulfosporosinus sp. I2 TaxID=1617025 RepID=UPI0005EDA707|nr:hypothetical protein [Desulfosporosinus sp. I2]KJR44980.1 hypothetical protein UF75_4640 [Desulfosporosinus sp. I2]